MGDDGEAMTVEQHSGRAGGTLRQSARALAVSLAALVCLVAATAANAAGPAAATYVAPGLLARAHDNPAAKLRVIVQSEGGARAAERAVNGIGSLRKRLRLVGAVAAEVPAGRLDALARVPGLTITPDADVRLDALNSSSQIWPYADGFGSLWGNVANPAPQAPTIAVIDSGIDANRADFGLGTRVAASVNLTTRDGNSQGDGRGHGTLVAGIAAGSAAGYAGGAPNARIVSLDVMDDAGVARTSDVIAAAEWIVANKGAYNIRVANFSLHSATPSNFTRDPLDRAVEKLWFAGVVVIASAGNYAEDGRPSGVRYAPGNDPFVITVGAADLRGTLSETDNTVAPWSAYGYTYDGFQKPDVVAAGRYMVGPVPASSTLATERADRLVAPNYIQLSGTSFSAPVVAAAAAQILARRPDWTPDQVKGALMVTARRLPLALSGAAGVGEIHAARAASVPAPPNPNAALNRFVVSDPNGGALPVFDATAWSDAARADLSWDSTSWADTSWSSTSWSSLSWESTSWESTSWHDLSSADLSWESTSWHDLSWESAADSDGLPAGGYFLDPVQQAAVEQDPEALDP